MSRIIAFANQKGGVGKTTTCSNVGFELVRKGYKVLIIDTDPQDGNLTASLGFDTNQLDYTLFDVYKSYFEGHEVNDWKKGILHHDEGIDLIPCNRSMSDFEMCGVNNENTFSFLKKYLSLVPTEEYDYILIDCPPTLGLTTINAFTASNSILIVSEAAYLPIRGIQSLLGTIVTIKKKINRKLKIDGIIFTKVDMRCNHPKEAMQFVQMNYGNQINVFNTYIPLSIYASEATGAGISIYKRKHDCKTALAFSMLVDELIKKFKGEELNTHE